MEDWRAEMLYQSRRLEQQFQMRVNNAPIITATLELSSIEKWYGSDI